MGWEERLSTIRVPEHLGRSEPHRLDTPPRQVGATPLVTADLAEVVAASVRLEGQTVSGR